MYDGCGGLETPLLFESLSSEDLADLEGLLGRDSLDFWLQLRHYAPTAQERDTEARASLVQREIASILAPFSSERLAERVYNTMSFLRHLLVKIRDLQDHIQRLDADITSDHALWLQDTNHALEREWTAMCQYWYHYVQDVERRSSATMAAQTRFFRNMEEGLKRKAQTLQDENTRLRTELRAAQDAQEAAERRADDNVLDPDDLLDFLMRDESGVTVISNWERLRDIFRHYAEGTKPPSTWNTQINVTAMDNVRYMPPDYVKPGPRPRNPRGGGGSGPKPSTPKPVRVLDLTGSGGSGPSNTTSRKLEFDVTEERQMRPKEHCPRDDLPCGLDEALDSVREADAQNGSRMGYPRTPFGKTDEPIHHLLPGYMVQLMLAQMIDWGILDFTPWSKYVPESIHLDAERIWTEIRVVDGRGLEKWPSLDKCDRKLQKLRDVAAEVEMINGALSESSEDETQDLFSLKPGAEEADNALETRDETEYLDDGADEDEVPTNVTDTSPKTASQASSGTRRPSPNSGKKSKATSRAPDTKVIMRVKTNTGRAKGVRHPTDLATRDFQYLSEDELLIIESSWNWTNENLRVHSGHMLRVKLRVWNK
ncbi:hypothetical protein PHMEG_00013619 [Phytophthora megakarya]|uniref:Uncharacterized protein n=1 Tax=Phytophthora megakarya TaxID=4795 RepID=A0A225W6A1_9STRA|nr:hypothetical protein PHMEG_00013619 [Phytophthora megakarya]